MNDLIVCIVMKGEGDVLGIGISSAHDVGWTVDSVVKCAGRGRNQVNGMSDCPGLGCMAAICIYILYIAWPHCSRSLVPDNAGDFS